MCVGEGGRKVVKCASKEKEDMKKRKRRKKRKKTAAITRGNEVWKGILNAVLHIYYGKEDYCITKECINLRV